MRDTLNEQECQLDQELNVESMAKVVFRHLKKKPKSYLDGSDFSFYVEVLRGELKSELFPEENRYQSYSNNAKFLDAITLLERRGLVVRNIPSGGRGGNPHQFVVYLTSIGIKSNIDGGVILLIDRPEETVGKIEAKVGTLDDVVRQYYIESLRAFQEGLYISSVICLGAASERAIHWLAESIEPYSEKYRGKIETKRRGNISDLEPVLKRKRLPKS